MLVNTMTDSEVYIEVVKDYQAIQHSIDRIVKDYDKKRRKNKIDKKKSYSQSHSFKSKLKNNWTLVLNKSLSSNSYKGLDSIAWTVYTYYFSKIGLRVLKIPASNEGLIVYNGHLFNRYNTRMSLGLNEPLEKVKHFFTNNPTQMGKAREGKDGVLYTMTKVKNGLLLGDVQMNGEWAVYKTFITNEMMHKEQDDTIRTFIDSFKKELSEDINKEDFDKEEFIYKSDVVLGVSPASDK